jgi:hypothetical protein
MALSKTQKKRNAAINQIVQNQGSEANSYAPIKGLFCDVACGIGLSPMQVIVDTPLSTGSRPDLSIWLDVPDAIRNENEHLYAVIEAKPGDQVKKNSVNIAKEKIPLYRRSRLRHLWLLDAQVIERYDFSGADDTSIPTPHKWEWNDLTQEESFDSCFGPLMEGRPTLASLLRDFASKDVPELSIVGTARRKEFIDSVVTVARIISRAVTDLVDTHLIPDLKKALTLIAPLEAIYGKPGYDWYSPDEYLIFPDEPDDLESMHAFNKAYAHLIEDLDPYKYALRAETQQLKHHAERSGLKQEDVSFLKNNDHAKAGREAFIQETASLLLSRLLMIRFSEDHELLSRYLSNGGLSAFARYAEHFRRPYQCLVREAYNNAKLLYHHLFEKKALDWIIDRDDQRLGMEFLHAMWILARFDFSSVRGDILSGVYDKYLEPTQRKRLGEVYTRPELARYMLDACQWDKGKTILDPACGTGTFLVEAFDMTLRAAEESGLGFDMDDAVDLLQQLHGLDINEFSATLAKIQLLWHVLAGAEGAEGDRIKQAIRILKIEGGHSSLDTWGIPMEASGSGQVGFDYTYKARRKALKASDRSFRDISTLNDHFDIVIGNPPYVRVHRVKMSTETAEAFADVTRKQTDLSAYFVYRALKWWLKPGGKMAFFLPLAVTEAAYGEKLRKLFDEYRIIEIVDLELLGNVAFHGANIVTIILIVEKALAAPDDQVKITTVDEACYDPITGLVDMAKATSVNLCRSDISLGSYLPENEMVVAEGEASEEEEDDASANALLTKLRQGDASILKEMSALPRLISLIQTGYKHRKKPKLRSIYPPPAHEAFNWHKVLIRGRGVEIGGKKPSDVGGLPILKGGDVFPDGVSGSPFGYWDGVSESISTPRFYYWGDCICRDRTYVIREISLAPTVAPHPTDTYLQNTVYIMQLAEKFPLNIYILSRIVRWYMVKTARASAIQKQFCHWFPRNLLRAPVPVVIGPEFVEKLEEAGAKLFTLDREIALGEATLSRFVDTESGESSPLRHRSELITNGIITLPDPQDYPVPEANWENVVAVYDGTSVEFQLPIPGGLITSLPAKTASGKPCRITINDLRLRRWITWVANDNLVAGTLPSQSWARNLPIPADLDKVDELLDRVENGQAIKDLEICLNELDAIVAKEIGLSDDDRDYIINQMKTDSLLLKMQPAWRHTSGRRRVYTAYGDERTY